MRATLRNLDLNLMVILDALITERSVTAASERLGMTQPAVSNALNRLRHLLGDRLFIRSGTGMVPTPRTLEIAVPLREALRTIETAVVPQAFDPSTAQHTFRLALSDAAILALLPALTRRLAQWAPDIAILTQPKALPSLPNLLDKNQIDMAVGLFPSIPPRFESRQLFTDHYVCLMRRGHPLEGVHLTLQTLATVDHISLRAVPSATAQIDDHMRDAGLTRRIKVTTNQVAAIPHMLIDTDLVACILGVCAQTVSQILPDAVIRRPVPIDPVEIRLVWHSEIINTAAAAWLRNEILEVAAEVMRAPQR